MNVYIKRCGKITFCKFCGLPIHKGEFEVVTELWSNKEIHGKNVNWVKKRYWHTENSNGIHCWEAQGISAVSKRPEVPTMAGRKPLNIPPEMKAKRNKIINRHSATVSRIRESLEGRFGCPNFDNVARLGEILAELKVEIEDYGGAPKSW